MDPAAETKPARRGFRRIAWIGWCVLGCAALLVLGNVGLILVNINQTSQPPAQADQALKIAIVSGEPDAQATASLPRVIISQSDLKTSTTKALDGAFVEPPRFQVSEPTQKNIDAINAIYVQTVRAYEVYQRDLPGLSYTEASERLGKIYFGWWDSVRTHYFGEPGLTSGGGMDKIEVLDDIYNRLSLDLAVKNNDWLRASTVCRYAHWGWSAEVYYLQKAGKPGNYIIATRTSERYWIAMKRSLMSVGPGFHWPQPSRYD